MSVFDYTESEFIDMVEDGLDTNANNLWWTGSAQMNIFLPYVWDFETPVIGKLDHSVIITDIYARGESPLAGTLNLNPIYPNNVKLSDVPIRSIDNIKTDSGSVTIDGNTTTFEYLNVDNAVAPYNVEYPIDMKLKIGSSFINISIGNTFTKTTVTTDYYEIYDNDSPLTYIGDIQLLFNSVPKNLKNVQIIIKYLYKEEEGYF